MSSFHGFHNQSIAAMTIDHTYDILLPLLYILYIYYIIYIYIILLPPSADM